MCVWESQDCEEMGNEDCACVLLASFHSSPCFFSFLTRPSLLIRVRWRYASMLIVCELHRDPASVPDRVDTTVTFPISPCTDRE